MPRNVHSEINLHIVWHTKQSAPVLTDTIENRTHRHIQHRVLKTAGVLFHAVGGIENHVHVVVSVPPTLNIAEWIGELKGASSHYINHEIANRKLLEWQTGHGVVSFGTKDLEWVVDYVRNQRQHHARGTTHERLERTEAEAADDKPVETGEEARAAAEPAVK